jgi:hypothetical protein
VYLSEERRGNDAPFSAAGILSIFIVDNKGLTRRRQVNYLSSARNRLAPEQPAMMLTPVAAKGCGFFF